MKKYAIIILTALILYVVMSAEADAQSLYDFREFTVTLEKYPEGRNPYTSVVITLDGRGVYTRQFKGKNFELIKNKDFRLTVEQLEYLYVKIMQNNFLEIGNVVGNPDKPIKFITKVTVQFDQQIHEVTLYNERFLALDDVINTILKVLPGDYSKTFDDNYKGEDDRITIDLD